MTLASAWYESGTFWAGAGVVVALVAAVGGAWVAFTVGFPRRRLYYGMRAAAPLLIGAAGMSSDLELLHRGKPLTNPRVVTVELVSRGRLDIPSDAYDSQTPFQLDVGATIVELLQITSVPATVPVPQISIEGSALQIGPSLIGKRHEITIAVLTDGERPRLACQSPLVNVQIRKRDYGLPPPPSWRHLLWPIVLIAAAILYFLLPSH